jgi:hypothetical protein
MTNKIVDFRLLPEDQNLNFHGRENHQISDL